MTAKCLNMLLNKLHLLFPASPNHQKENKGPDSGLTLFFHLFDFTYFNTIIFNLHWWKWEKNQIHKAVKK